MKLDTTLLAETPEGIDILLRPAGAVARALAYALDFLIRFVVWSVAAAVLGGVKGVGVGADAGRCCFALEWLYPIVFELLPGAATPGKRALGLQVMMDTGLPVTPSAAVTRNLLRVADFMPVAYAFGLLSDAAAARLQAPGRHRRRHAGRARRPGAARRRAARRPSRSRRACR